MSQPLVSILIPAYNVEKYVGHCLDSIVGGNYQNLQVVIVDDGSTDNTGQICDNYASRYPVVEVYHIANGGVANARNVLLSKVKGDFVLFIDSDDWIEPNMVESMIALVNEYSLDMVVCGSVSEVDESLSETNKDTEIPIIWNRMTAIEKFLFHNVSFDTAISYGEDALVIWQILQKLNHIGITRSTFYHYRSNMESISRQPWSIDKRGSGYVVWRRICTNVSKSYPQYLHIAYARCALEDMWALYFASISGYPYDEHIKFRQNFIRQHSESLKKYPIGGWPQYYTAILLSKFYGFGKLINLVHRLLRKF